MSHIEGFFVIHRPKNSRNVVYELKDATPITKVVTKIALIIEPIGAFFVSTVNNEVIIRPLFGLNILKD